MKGRGLEKVSWLIPIDGRMRCGGMQRDYHSQQGSPLFPLSQDFLSYSLGRAQLHPCYRDHRANQIEGMGLLTTRLPVHVFFAWRDGVLCTFSNRSAPDRGKWCGPSGQAAWTVNYVQNHTLLGHSPPASQAGRRVGTVL
jgi:hypothetical protein